MVNNALLLSIRPEYASKIFDGTKTVELRRIYPKQIGEGSLVFVYISSPVKALKGAFKVEKIIEKPLIELWELVSDKAGITHEEFISYYEGISVGVGIFFKDIWSLEEPFELQSVRDLLPDFHPPQGFRYQNLDWLSGLIGTSDYMTLMNDPTDNFYQQMRLSI